MLNFKPGGLLGIWIVSEEEGEAFLYTHDARTYRNREEIDRQTLRLLSVSHVFQALHEFLPLHACDLRANFVFSLKSIESIWYWGIWRCRYFCPNSTWWGIRSITSNIKVESHPNIFIRVHIILTSDMHHNDIVYFSLLNLIISIYV